MVTDIGKALGKLDDYELTTSIAWIRVCIDGLQPLTQETVIDFEHGEDAIVTLVYERHKNHCKRCFRLSHKERDCPKKTLPSNHKELAYATLPDQRQHRLTPIVEQSDNSHHRSFHDRHGRPFGERIPSRKSR